MLLLVLLFLFVSFGLLRMCLVMLTALAVVRDAPIGFADSTKGVCVCCGGGFK